MKKLKNFKQQIFEKYNLDIKDISNDIYVSDNVIYVSSQCAAKFLKSGYHNFGNQYADLLVKAGVRRLRLGRNKYYSIFDLSRILARCIEYDFTIFDVCEAAAKKIKKKQKQIEKKVEVRNGDI